MKKSITIAFFLANAYYHSQVASSDADAVIKPKEGGCHAGTRYL
jgi:hypothetical protein